MKNSYIAECEGIINGHIVAVGGHFGLLKRVVQSLLKDKVEVRVYNLLSDTYKKAFDTHNISTFNKYSGYYKRIALLGDKEILTAFIAKLNSALDVTALSETELINLLPKLRATGGGAKQKVTIQDKLNKAELIAKELSDKVRHAENIARERQETHDKKELLKEEQRLLKIKQDAQKAEEFRLASLSPKDLKLELKVKKEKELKLKKEEERLLKIENDKIEIALKKEESKNFLSIISNIRSLSDDSIMIKVASCNQKELKAMIEALKIFIL